MATKPTKRTSEYDVIEPIGKRVVVRKDDNKRQTRSGIVLPDSHEIPVITGRVIAISKAIEHDEDQTIRQYDKVLFDPREAIPVELEHDNRLFVVALDRVLAIFRRSEPPAKPAHPKDDGSADEE
jgi:chaperonin GroES